MAGDSGYPISEVLQKPYTTQESAQVCFLSLNGNTQYYLFSIQYITFITFLQDVRKRLFNRRISGLRTMMSECVFGRWKRRFPILRNLRMDLEMSQKVIIVTGILENWARDMYENEEWTDDESGSDEDSDDVGDGGDGDRGQEDYVIVDQVPGTVRVRGQIVRDNLLMDMPN
jgi:hypothetical protein